jgi:hypothetical protein
MQYRRWYVRRFCAIWVACEGSFVGQTMAFRWGWNSLDRPSNPRRHVWPTNLRFSSDNLLLFFHLFSLLLNFYASPFKFHSSPSICFFLLIWSLFFWLRFILFEINYKIRIFFQFHPLSMLLLVKFCPYSFDCYLFYWDNI